MACCPEFWRNGLSSGRDKATLFPPAGNKSHSNGNANALALYKHSSTLGGSPGARIRAIQDQPRPGARTVGRSQDIKRCRCLRAALSILVGAGSSGLVFVHPKPLVVFKAMGRAHQAAALPAPPAVGARSGLESLRAGELGPGQTASAAPWGGRVGAGPGAGDLSTLQAGPRAPRSLAQDVPCTHPQHPAAAVTQGTASSWHGTQISTGCLVLHPAPCAPCPPQLFPVPFPSLSIPLHPSPSPPSFPLLSSPPSLLIVPHLSP